MALFAGDEMMIYRIVGHPIVAAPRTSEVATNAAFPSSSHSQGTFGRFRDAFTKATEAATSKAVETHS